MGLISKTKKAIATMKSSFNDPYDMSTKESREIRGRRDYEYAKTQKFPHIEKMRELDDYYHNKHLTAMQMAQLVEDKGWTFMPPVLPDPFIQVESQIDTLVPQFEFKGRDHQMDPAKAIERQKIVEYICYNNRLPVLNIENERPLNKLGNAFWKVSFDGTIQVPGAVGDIVIGNPDPANIFPDPSAYDVEGCEWIIYAFRMHRRKARRIYGKQLDDIGADGNHSDTEIYTNSDAQKRTINDDTVQVVEYWYRDDDGDIACSTQINYVEVKHIPKYWESTASSGNNMYPFIKYCKIPIQQSFWDMGEIEPIMDLVDAADREFMNALLNDAFMANDITVLEEHALVDGQQMQSTPSAVIITKDNKIDKVRRLGGIAQNSNALNMINFIHEKIQETSGNFDTSQGKEPVRVTTASGIAQLNEKAQARKVMKKADRLAGFNRLYELLDWTALEFFNTDRVIRINGKDDPPPMAPQQMPPQGTPGMPPQPQMTQPPQQPPQAQPQQPITFNSSNHQLVDPTTKEKYFPRIDSEITSGEGVIHSVSFTLSATQELAAMNITMQNYKIVLAYVDLLDLPNKDEVKQSIETWFAHPPVGMPSVTMAFKDLPAEAKAQELAKIGIYLTRPLVEMDAQGVPWSILANNVPNVNGRVPLESQVQGRQIQQGQQPQQPMDPHTQVLQQLADQAHVNLTTEELQRLSQAMTGNAPQQPPQGAKPQLQQGNQQMQGNEPQQGQDPLTGFPPEIQKLLMAMDPQHQQTILKLLRAMDPVKLQILLSHPDMLLQALQQMASQ